jgi:flagellar motor switch protein FliN
MRGRLAALVNELAAVMGAQLTASAEVSAGELTSQRRWVATLTASGRCPGSCAIAIDHAGAAMFSRLASGSKSDVEDVTVADTLRGVVAQAAAALGARPAAERLELTLLSLEPRTAAAQESEQVAAYTIAIEGLDAPMAVAVTWTAVDADATRLATIDERLGSRIDVILDIELPVMVRFGHTELPLRALSRLGPGSVIDLGRSPDDPVEVLVSNRVVARGEVVIVGGNYGVRILDVTSQSERARSMEA